MMSESDGVSDRLAWIIAGVVTALGCAAIFAYQFSYSSPSPTDTKAVPQNKPASTQQNSVTTSPQYNAVPVSQDSVQSSDFESTVSVSFVLGLTGSDWHSFSSDQKATVADLISSRLQNKHPIASPRWIVRQLDTYYKGGFGRSDNVFDIVAMCIVTSENE